jgi:uncharacterized protein YegP (UPF0339 family)
MRKSRVKLYRDKKNEWRWEITDFRNKKIIGASTEGYKTRSAMLSNLLRVVRVGSNLDIDSVNVMKSQDFLLVVQD